MKKPLKITLIVVGSLLLIIFIATLLVGTIATSYVNKNGKELVGRRISVDDISVNIYSGHVAIENFKLYEDDDTTVFASFDTLDVKAKLLKLLSDEVYLKHITLAGLDVKVLQDGDKFNFTSMLDFFDSGEEEEVEEDTTSSDWKLSFYNINLSRGRIYYADQQLGCDWDVNNLDIRIPGFCIGGDQATDAGITLQLADGGTLNTDVNYDVNTNDFNAVLNLDNFAISNVKAYLTDVMRINKMDGILDAHIQAQGNLDRIMEMAINGNLALSNVDIRSDQNAPVVALKRLDLEVEKLILDKDYYNIKSIAIDGLSSRYDLYANGDNFSRLFIEDNSTPETPDTTAAAPAAESSEMVFRIGSLAVTNSAFTYADHTLPDPFEFPITKLQLHAQNINLSGENAATISASLPHGGTAFIDWKGNIDDIYAHQHLKLDIKNLQMADLSPYTVAYLAWPFADGTLTFTSLNNIRNSMLDGQNHLDIYKATAGDKRKDVEPEIKGIPLKAALYVLKDKDDKIMFDVPISGNIESPEFNYMKLVWKTLGNLLVKVASEPFRAAGRALGVGGDDEQFIAVDPQQIELTSEQYYELEKYASAMNQLKGLSINLEHQIDAASDSLAIQNAAKIDEQVKSHLTKEMNVPEKQITITTNMVENLKKPGYNITGKLEEE